MTTSEAVQEVKPLFIPLKAEYFNAFADGSKSIEYRPYGARWNERTCPVGRPVVLSYGYGKARRLRGRVTGFARSTLATTTDAWRDCYGDRHCEAACIRIAVEKKR
jgi:hypothetical protein